MERELFAFSGFESRQVPIFSVSQHAGASVIEVRHDLDIATTDALDRALSHATWAPENRIVVSLADCRYCDASGLRVLLRAKTRLGDRLSIVVPRSGLVRRIFELTNLVAHLDLIDDLDPALDAEASSS